MAPQLHISVQKDLILGDTIIRAQNGVRLVRLQG